MLLKHQVRQSFNQAAQYYDNAAVLQNTVAMDLLMTLPATEKTIVDVGCGTGFLTDQLAKKFSTANILGVDFSEHMLRHAQKKTSQNNIDWLCADVAYLPLPSDYAEIVTTNLMLQWSSNVLQNLTEIHRILKAGGQLFFSTFAPGSLCELQTAWQHVDDKPHIHPFTTAETLIDHCLTLNVQLTLSKKSYTFYYTDALSIMRNLKNLGASNRSPERTQGLTTPKKLQAAIAAYELFRDDQQRLPVSYEIYFGMMQK